VTRVVFLLVPDVHLLDLSGPAQVFFSATDLGLNYQLAYVADHDEVRSAQGLPLRTETTLPELAPDDLVLVPGWHSPKLAGTGPVSGSLCGS
jgi:transcriptional regulator GlxA family with amidase domain